MAIISKQRTKQAAIVAPVKRQSSLNELFRNLVVPAAALLIASQLVAAQTVEANPRIISGDFNSIAGPRNTGFVSGSGGRGRISVLALLGEKQTQIPFGNDKGGGISAGNDEHG